MRERTLRVNKEKLSILAELYKPSKVAKTLDISKQRWYNYVIGRNDMPESLVKKLCAEFNLPETEIVLN